MFNTALQFALRQKSYALCLLCGLLLPLSFAPASCWPLAILSLAGFAYSIQIKQTNKAGSALTHAFFFHLGGFAAGASWVYVSIHDFGFTAAWLALVLTSVFVLFLALVSSLPWLLCRTNLNNNTSLLLLFPSLLIASEWLRSWLFTGFPWLYVGYSHIDSPLSGWAPVLGVFGLSFISALSAALLLLALKHTRALAKTRAKLTAQQAKRRLAELCLYLCSVLLLFSSGVYLQNIEWTQASQEKQLVALLQPNVPLPMKWNPYHHPKLLSDLDKLASPWWEADIQIWPEAAIPGLRSHAGSFIDEINERATKHKTNVFTGALWDEDNGEVYNSVIALGSAKGHYFKQKLVPFGEYVPFEDQLRGLIAFFDLPNSVIRRGPFKNNALQASTRKEQSYNIAPFICYEVVYPDFVARNARDSQVMLTISNDAWFGDSIGPLQHFEMARMRALENQKYMLRSTNTGISAIIGERGQVLKTTRPFIKSTVIGVTELRQGLTPMARFGSTPILVLSLILMALGLTHTYKIRKAHVSH
ncbi:apolipoprotein N-acyltransferase [Agaribacterium sp. ZY112]|uniref:apolipoprotein N-acyltransferase n=1 Tax=Agaribacterium sp. ZY112 TaxID=3233574 RepID=UPI0035261B5F